MKKINLNFVLIAVLLLSSCGLKDIHLPVPVQLEPADEFLSVPVQLEPADELFSKAEKLYQMKSYEEALDAYNEYLSRFPEHNYAVKAKNIIEELSTKSVYSRYTIGCLLPLSGYYKAFGDKALKGIELALGQFCSQDDRPSIKIIIKDTGSDPDVAVNAVNELFEEHVAAIIGPIFTAEPAALEAQNRGIPIITITQKDNIADTGDYVFRNFFTPKMQVETIVSYAIEELELKNFAILYPNENYGKVFMNLFWDEVMACGGKVVGVESYELDSTDFADPIKKLVGLYYELPEDLKNTDELIEGEDKSDDFEEVEDEADDYEEAKEEDGWSEEEYDEADEPVEKNGTITEDELVAEDKLVAEEEFVAEEELVKEKGAVENDELVEDDEPEPIIDFDAIFIPDSSKRAGLIIPHLSFYDVGNVYLFGTNLWHSDMLIKMARNYAQNAIMPDIFFAESSSENVRNFVMAFEKTFGEKPGFIEAVAYDTAMMLFQIVSRPDVRFRSAVKNELIKLSNFQGVTGLTSFDNNGGLQKDLYLLKIKGNKFVELE